MNESQFIAKYNKFGSLNIPVKGNFKGSYDADLPQHELAILNRLFDAGKIELGTVSPHGASYTIKPAGNGTIQVELYRVIERQNYRQTYNESLVETIASDMAQNGFDSGWPIKVYRDGDNFVVIDGHTRRRAALLGSTYDIKERKARMLVWIAVKPKPTDAQFMLQQMAANELREQPDNMSQAIGYKRTLDAGATMDQLCQATGHKQPYIDKRLAFLTLTPEAQVMVSKGTLSPDYAYELTRLKAEYQCAALSAYTRASRRDFVTFKEIVEDLLMKQIAAENEQLPLFGGALESLISATIETIEAKRAKSRADLESENAALIAALDNERIAHKANKAKAVAKLTAMQNEIIFLRSQVDLLKKVS